MDFGPFAITISQFITITFLKSNSLDINKLFLFGV